MQSSLLPLRRRVAPLITLLFLAPFIIEILWGSTHITILYVFIPEVGVYGCAALIIRALVRYQHKGWTTILILGIAYAIAEECVILQSSLYPLFAADPQHIYGRALGINWIYLLFSMGYESVWSIVLPIQLTELIFPDRRNDPWLGKPGMIIAAICFFLASFVAWYSWTQITVPRYYPQSHYQTPLLTILIALIAIAVLATIALGSRLSSLPMHNSTRTAPHPWLVGIVTFVLGLSWFAQLYLHYGLFPAFPVAIAVVLILAWAAGTFLLIRYWSSGQGWSDAHRLALIFGALIASMLAGFQLSGITLPIDFIGKLILNVIAILALAYLSWRIHQRKTAHPVGMPFTSPSNDN